MTDNKKAKGLSKEEIKKKWLNSMTTDEIVEFDDLNKEAEETQDLEEAVNSMKILLNIIILLNSMKILLKQKIKGL